MAYEKHVGVYNTMNEFTEELNNSVLISPWVAYVKKEDGNDYNVFYSNDMSVSHSSLNIAEILTEKITKLENRMVSLTEDEYDALIALPEGEVMTVTSPDGTTKDITYDPTVYYCTYDPSDLNK